MTLHYFDPHYTYMHHPQFDYSSWYKGKVDPNEKFRKLKANSGKYSEEDINFLIGLYREEIKFTDSHIGRLLEEINKRGLDQNTLIIFMADHGEEFLEHGSMGHSHTLYNELTHVPLIFSMPGLIPADKIEEPVSTLDLMPTIEGLFQDPQPRSYWKGRDLSRTVLGETFPEDFPVFSELSYESLRLPPAYKVSVVKGKDKLIFDKITKKHELFDLANDPQERNNLAIKQPEVVKELDTLIQNFTDIVNLPIDKSLTPGKATERSKEEIKKLKSLGYF